MTEPAIPTIKRSGSRFYVHPTSQEKVPSVTSVNGMLPKKALQYWRGKLVAETAVDDLSVVGALVSTGNPSAAVDHLKRAPDRSSGKAAKTGTDVHELCERLNRGEDVGRVHPDLAGFIDQYGKFLDAFQPRFIEVEATAWSETHSYAGTLDWIAEIDGEVVIGDLKTGASGIWPEVSLQLEAYARADYLIDPDGTQRPVPAVSGGCALHLRPDFFSLIPIRLGDDVWETFQALLKVSNWEHQIAKTVIGKTPVDPI